MTKPKPVTYQAVYLWECPHCGTTWQARHRPRGGAQLVCGPQAEQALVGTVAKWQGLRYRGCGVISTSAGRRGGIAPTVSI